MTLAHFAFEPVPAVADAEPHPFTSIDDPLGPLAALPGTWIGTGFNTIWRPHFPSGSQDRFLELNLTSETLVFEEIPGAIPNRGLDQKDIEMFGVHYMQTDLRQHPLGRHPPRAGHLGDRARGPPPRQEPPTVVRMASIPHGTASSRRARRSRSPGRRSSRTPTSSRSSAGDPSTKGSFADAQQSFPELNLSKKTKFRQPSDATTAAGHHPGAWSRTPTSC